MTTLIDQLICVYDDVYVSFDGLTSELELFRLCYALSSSKNGTANGWMVRFKRHFKHIMPEEV